MSILHVHRHEHHGIPQFSPIDSRSMRKFVPGFFNACGSRPHGAIVLSMDAASGAIWLGSGEQPRAINEFQVIGAPLRRWNVR